MADPQQELFSRLKLDIEAAGYDVYDTFLPPEGTPYPFVYLGNFTQNDNETKSEVIGYVYPQIHVWHNNPRQRGTVSKMLCDIKAICRRIARTDNYAWMIQNVRQQILADNTTKTPLIHGVIESDWRFS
jgi:hypothetical protein